MSASRHAIAKRTLETARSNADRYQPHEKVQPRLAIYAGCTVCDHHPAFHKRSHPSIILSASDFCSPLYPKLREASADYAQSSSQTALPTTVWIMTRAEAAKHVFESGRYMPEETMT